MDLLQAVILGIIQGVTEFLPVSSSGHLALFHALFGHADVETSFELMFDVVVHLGTLVSVVIVLRKEVFSILRRPFQKLTAMLIIASLPIIPAGLFIRGERMDFLRTSMPFLMGAFIFTALILLYADNVKKPHLTKEIKDISLADSLTIGILQAVAICPGISRSGSATAASLFRKLKREDAARFVFLISIPAILGAVILEGMDIVTGRAVLRPEDIPVLAFGFTAALLSGYLAVNLVFKLIQKARLRYFSYYLFALAAFVGVDTFILGGRFFGGAS